MLILSIPIPVSARPYMKPTQTEQAEIPTALVFYFDNLDCPNEKMKQLVSVSQIDKKSQNVIFYKTVMSEFHIQNFLVIKGLKRAKDFPCNTKRFLQISKHTIIC